MKKKVEKYLLTIDGNRDILFKDYLSAEIARGRMTKHTVSMKKITVVVK